MRQRHALHLILLITASLLVGFSGDPADKVLRYRGEYTYGHEVRSFCPAINSQCYWVGADTTRAVHAALKELAIAAASAPYTPVCVVIEGRIDRETERTGFAADYGGLVSVTRVFGRCDDVDIVTQGDLQHHRWLLESIDDKPIEAATQEGMIPELDFGERMFVSGNTGCNQYTGRGMLREEYFVIERIASTRRMCMKPQDDIERTVLQVLGSESVIRIGAGRQLTLEAEQAVLRFRLFDWKQ